MNEYDIYVLIYYPLVLFSTNWLLTLVAWHVFQADPATPSTHFARRHSGSSATLGDEHSMHTRLAREASSLMGAGEEICFLHWQPKLSHV